MTDDMDNWLRAADAYRKAVETAWPGRYDRLSSVGTDFDDFCTITQDRKPGLAAFTGRQRTRFVEEMNVYDADGTLLGSMTLSHTLLMPRWHIPAWLTPAYIRTEIVREDLIRASR